jgi:membrane protein YqaA with SNARE-associated domain
MLDVLASHLTDPKLWLIVLALCAFGLLERWTIFYASQRKGKAILHELPGFTPERKDSLERLHKRWGSSLLLVAGIPLIGNLFAALAGAGNTRRVTFVVLVAISYLFRSWLIVILSGEIISTIF